MSLPVDATCFDLHVAIQAAFGWYGCHLHCFEVQEHGVARLNIGWREDVGVVLGFVPFAYETGVRLDDLFGRGLKTLHYTYDLGDDWRHRIRLEKTVEDEGTGPVAPFEVVKGRGADPVEDSGGIHGFMDLIKGVHPACDLLPADRLDDIQNGVFRLEQVTGLDPLEEIVQLTEMNAW